MTLAEMLTLAPTAPPDPDEPLAKKLIEYYGPLFTPLVGPLAMVFGASMATYWLNLINEHGIPEDLESIIHGEGE